ncbi:MAG: DEAD/DEAH box helicase [Burkholderiales bacterium]
MSFSKLGLSEELVRAVTEHGYTQPTPIQLQAIPAVLAGGDLLARAQTGTGKTAGFVLPILQRLTTQRGTHDPRPIRKTVRALVLTPTRELAAQVEQSVRVYGKHAKLSSTVVFGGIGINPQIAQLKRGVDILVATPGRLLDLHQQKALDLRHVEILVLDEADRMLDMGFIKDIRRILSLLPKQRQNLLFSATLSDEIKALAADFLHAPGLIEVARSDTTLDAITQTVHPVNRDRKRALLAHLITTRNWSQVLVFTRTKSGANKLAEQLDRDGIAALAIHGNKSQPQRTRTMAQFKSEKLRVMVATDIAARGIDIIELLHVVNYDLPHVAEDYIHRIGRTGRAGASGEAVSLVSVDDNRYLASIERRIKLQIPKEVIAGFEPDANAKPEPAQKRSQRHGSPRSDSKSNARNGRKRYNDVQPRREARANGNQAPRRGMTSVKRKSVALLSAR